MIKEKDGYYTIVQACRKLNTVEYYVKKMAKKGLLKIEKIDGRNWIKQEMVEDYIEKNGVIKKDRSEFRYPELKEP